MRKSAGTVIAALLACAGIATALVWHWYRDSNWWLVIIAALTGAVIAWQSWEARKSVKAADKNATALVNSGRAWVMVEARLELGAGISFGSEGTYASVVISIFNAGPTPAWVYEQWVQLEVSPEVKVSRTKYQSPNFPFLGEGRTGDVNYGIFPVASGQEPVTWKAFVGDKGFAAEGSGLHIYIYGIVRYWDAFSSLRETYFGYVVRGKRLERIPNEAYNRHT